MNSQSYAVLTAQLSDQQAIAILSDIASKWIESDPVVATCIIRKVDKFAVDSLLDVPAWIDDPSINQKDAGNISRSALLALAESEDEDVRAWTRTAIETPRVASGHMIEPVTATLCLAGLILASRVKKVGPDGVEFYEGVPEGLSKLLKAARGFFGLF